MWAVKRNDLMMTHFLLKVFARVNFSDFAGRTPLNFAVTESNLEIVKLLLCYKADPMNKTNEGISILDAYDKSLNKNTNVKIGHYMRICRDQLNKQVLIQDSWKFCKRSTLLLVDENAAMNKTYWSKH